MRTDLPDGTITLLFTDVEGSTKLLHEVGDDAYSLILAEHHRLCRQAWDAHRGVEVETEGDAFFVVFEQASDALLATQAAQRLLEGGPLKVRMGMHTGPVLVRDTGYVGHTVHLAARIASSGYGGQVVLSRETKQAAGDGFVYVDLGEHRLKDIEDPTPIYQLGEGSHPPLRTISNTNLPHPRSSFLGRQREVSEVVAALERRPRLVTLTGPGGTGKSRLALEAAASVVGSFKAGVFWIPLAALRDSSLVTTTIAQTLGAKAGLAEHIGEREMLLLLDNLEQVIDCAPQLSALLLACSRLSLLVTSREVLRVQGEVEFAVPPLEQSEAVALFCERSHLEPSADIAELCTRLDNLPLAVELAAARTRALTPAQILQRLAQRLDLLKGGRDTDPRQQTLRATIEWSYELLSADEQTLFRHLAVFAGGCTLEAAETICDADLDVLQSLVEKSLVRFSEGRFWMLETIRQYAGDRLAIDGSDDVRQRHAAEFARLAGRLSEPVRSREPHALATVEVEHDNMRAALEDAVTRDDVVMASRLLAGLWFYWLITGQGREGSTWAHRYLECARDRTPPLDRYSGDDAASEILRFTGEAELAVQLKQDLIEAGRTHPDAVINGISMTRLTAGVFSDLAWMELDAGRIAQARSFAENGLAIRRQVGLPHGVAHAQRPLAGILFHEGDYSGAYELLREVAEGYEASANVDSDWSENRVLMAECALLLGRDDEARTLLRQTLPSVEQFEDRMLDVAALRVVGMLAATSRASEAGAMLFGAADRMLHDSHIKQFSDNEDTVYRSYRAQALEALGQASFDDAYDRGHEMSRGDAMAVARSAVD
jgi:predicted ATPase/class 3 adenylate cyclase